MTPMVKAEQVCKSFGALNVLKGITLEVGRGEVLCMVGPSGSGKSTFLRCINHLEKVNAGRLYVDGELIGYKERGGKLRGQRIQHRGLRPPRFAQHDMGAQVQGRRDRVRAANPQFLFEPGTIRLRRGAERDGPVLLPERRGYLYRHGLL